MFIISANTFIQYFHYEYQCVFVVELAVILQTGRQTDRWTDGWTCLNMSFHLINFFL